MSTYLPDKLKILLEVFDGFIWICSLPHNLGENFTSLSILVIIV